MSKTNKPNSMIPGVGYIRMSGDQQEASPERQRTEIVKLAAREGVKILRFYEDDGISGNSTDQRDAFQRMVRDAQELGDFKAIVAFDQDRWGRFDSIEAGYYIFPLRKCGVRLLTAAQGWTDWDNFAGRIVYQVTQEGKHAFLVDQVRHSLTGRILSARKGCGANRPPHGYDRTFYDDKGKVARVVPWNEKFSTPKGWRCRYTISTDAAAVAVVAWIFDMYANNDIGIRWIANDLNRRGIRSRSGCTWHPTTIQGILDNPVYTGRHSFGRHRVGKYLQVSGKGDVSKGGVSSENDAAVVVENVHDRLIDDETFARIQVKLTERAVRERRSKSGDYILSGVLTCGHCGGPMGGKAGSKNTRPHLRYYTCATAAKGLSLCRHYLVRKEVMEKYVLGVLSERLTAPELKDRIKTEVIAIAAKRGNRNGSAGPLKAKLADLEKRIAKGAENVLLADPETVSVLLAKLRDWRCERDGVKRQLMEAETSAVGDPKALAEKAVNGLDSLLDCLTSSDPKRLRSLVKAAVADLTLWWEPFGKRNRTVKRGVLTLADDFALLTGSR